jgi:heme/copper-type cytochrome/quinol oxidase subunit 2
MSKRLPFVLAATLASVIVGTAAWASQTIDVVASDWKFTPNTVVLHANQTTTLRLSSKEGVHGLQSDDLGIPMTALVSGSVKTLEVTPKKPGTYVLHCAIMCGAGHANMTLTVKVVP